MKATMAIGVRQGNETTVARFSALHGLLALLFAAAALMLVVIASKIGWGAFIEGLTALRRSDHRGRRSARRVGRRFRSRRRLPKRKCSTAHVADQRACAVSYPDFLSFSSWHWPSKPSLPRFGRRMGLHRIAECGCTGARSGNCCGLGHLCPSESIRRGAGAEAMQEAKHADNKLSRKGTVPSRAPATHPSQHVSRSFECARRAAKGLRTADVTVAAVPMFATGASRPAPLQACSHRAASRALATRPSLRAGQSADQS